MVSMPTIDLMTLASELNLGFCDCQKLRKEMFGGPSEPPKHARRSRPKPMTYDIQLPTLSPGVYGHMGRHPNTDQHVRVFEYRMHHRDDEAWMLSHESKRLNKEIVAAKYDKHAEKKVFQRRIQERFQEKVKDYQESIDQRREKLRELLCKEEQDFILETIEQAQKGVDFKMQEMKERAELLKAQREEERQKVVEMKRLQQAMEECKELRPVLVKRNLVDSKTTQLQQMKENEMRKESERELDTMWHNLMLKELEARMEQETQSMLKKNKTMKEMVEIWEKQIYGKELLRQEAEKIAAEDRIEMTKLREQLNRERIEELDEKRRKRDAIARELREQIALQEKYMEQRRQEDEALNNAYCQLAAKELEREKMKVQDTTHQSMRETAIYRQHLKNLEDERKREEVELGKLLEEHRKLVEKQQEEAYCKIKQAKEQLKKNVLAERAQQLEYKRQEAENQLKLKQAENELLRMAYETNERLQAEHDRIQAEEIRQYREDLKQQIDYNNEQRRLEKEQLERELAEGLAEEERRRQHVLEIIQARLDDEAFKHPLRRVLERKPCPCTDNS